MKGILFGGLHSYNDLHLILSEKEMGAPKVKTKKIDLEGADSALDLTDFFGEAKFEDVTHRFTFSVIRPPSEFLSLFTTIKNAIHGKRLRIILDDDPSFFWVGRCHVSSFTNEKNVGTVSVECDCEPWKYKQSITTVTREVNGTASIILANSRRRVVPQVILSAALGISFGSATWNLSAGTYTLPDLELAEGNNTVTVTGTGSITFRYQEAVL